MRNANFLIQSSVYPQSWIQPFRLVCFTNNYNRFSTCLLKCNIINTGQDLSNKSSLHSTLRTLSVWCFSVYLIHKYYARSLFTSFFKTLTWLLLRLAIIPSYWWCRNSHKGYADFSGNRLYWHSFTTARWPMKYYTMEWLYSDTQVKLRVG